MNETDIRNYAKLMEELGLTVLELTEGGRSVRMERPAFAPETGKAVPLPTTEPEAQATAEPEDLYRVISPIVGIFYASPTENGEPYVSVGDRVQKGQTLCIIEAMKLMNEIVAEEEGVVTEVRAANGQVVEYGTTLFCIRRARP